MRAEILNNSALLVIDMQRYFIDPKGGAFLDPPRALVPNVKGLIEAFRRSGRPVVFTRHAHKRNSRTGQMGRWWNDELLWDGDRDAELIAGIAPRDDDIFITKTRYSAFEETELDLALKRQGIDTVVICGVMTNLCVETTARHAFMKDLQPIVVDDACATKREDYHRASILNLSYGFAYVEATETIVGKLKKEAGGRRHE